MGGVTRLPQVAKVDDHWHPSGDDDEDNNKDGFDGDIPFNI